MVRMLTVWLLFCACTPSKERQCERIAANSLAMVSEVAHQSARVIAGKDLGKDFAIPPGAADAAKQRLVAACLTWPDDFVGCMAAGDFESERCVAAYAHKEGLVVAGKGEPGPDARSRPIGTDAALECQGDRCVIARSGHIEDLAGQTIAEGADQAADGRVAATAEQPDTQPGRLGDATYVVEDGRVSMESGGRRVWTVEVDADAVLTVPGAAASLFVASYWTADHPARLLVLDPTSGAVRLTMEVPSRMTLFPVTLGRDRDTIVMVTNDTLFTWDLDAIDVAL